MPTPTGDIVGQKRWYWPIFAAPVPAWNPAEWNFTRFNEVVQDLVSGTLRVQFTRTLYFVFAAVTLCILIGYPVAYYISRHAGRRKVMLLTLMILPFWMSYLMRMLAWVNLLNNEEGDPGLVNKLLQLTPLISEPVNWFAGEAAPITVILGLVYGYIPFFILPLYAALDRIDKSQLEASRDLGASPGRTFWRITLPLSKQGILAGSVIIMLPMFGDYYTPNLMSGAPNVSMIGNAIDAGMNSQARGPYGAAITLLLSLFIAMLMIYYLVSVSKAAKEARR